VNFYSFVAAANVSPSVRLKSWRWRSWQSIVGGKMATGCVSLWFLINAFAQCLSNYAYGASDTTTKRQRLLNHPYCQAAAAASAANPAGWAIEKVNEITRNEMKINTRDMDDDDHRMAIRHWLHLMHH